MKRHNASFVPRASAADFSPASSDAELIEAIREKLERGDIDIAEVARALKLTNEVGLAWRVFALATEGTRAGLSVMNDWIFSLPLQQQSVLILGTRGPDAVEKFHPAKLLVMRYRATVLKAAYYGRAMRVDEEANTFMSMENFSDDRNWDILVRKFFDSVDVLPHHYLMHLLHAAEIIAYRHPNGLFRERWSSFYYAGVSSLHLEPEGEDVMNVRLGDWERKYWREEDKPRG